MSRLSGTTNTAAAVAVKIDCEQKGDTSKHCVSMGPTATEPVSRHATATIITGPTFMSKRLCSFVDEFLLNGYPASLQ